MDVKRTQRGRRASGTVLARIVTHVLAFAAREGMHRDVLMKAAGLREADLAQPDTLVSFSALVALWQVIARTKSGTDAEFGLRWGASIRARDLGLLGYAMYYSATLDAALHRLVRYGHILTDSVQFEIEGPDPRHRVAVAQAHPALGAALPLAVDGRLAALVGVCREITGVQDIPAEVLFTYTQPRTIAEHRAFFRCPLKFSQAESKVVFRDTDLGLRVMRADETLAGYLSDHAEQILRTLVTGSSSRERVRAAIWALLSEGKPTLERIAATLHMSPRTLQRDLAKEGSSVQAEVERIRETMARATLRDRTLPIQEVAFLLGYAEPSSFYRSFRRWTGKTPHQYRTAAA